MSRTLKLGTRRSLLAWAQSGWVAREIERLNPGVKVELVGIETRGDKIQNVPLQSIPGKDFFVVELDEHLRSKQVDISVHSMKDLSLDRPAEFVCAAIPQRENPRDVALFGPAALERLRAGTSLRIGTSSPRRLENVPTFLRQALPATASGLPKFSFVEIRGNVNSRLARVLEEVQSERYLDGVILAFAGLIRLWSDESAREEMRDLLSGVRWMVLPLIENPTAPAQGALAVECRTADTEVRTMIEKLHDPRTAQHVHRERELLERWGGGCHQRFGATSISAAELGTILHAKGISTDGVRIDEKRWEAPGPRPSGFSAWNGAEWSGRRTFSRPLELPELKGRAVFVAHSRALPRGSSQSVSDSRVWCSGPKSWFKLASQGVWVEGCGENLGFDALVDQMLEPVLSLPAMRDWVALTHESAVPTWKDRVGETLGTYRIEEAPPSMTPEQEEELCAATHFWWTSGAQFDALQSLIPRDAHHACGPGKTYEHLQARGVNPVAFPAMEDWKKWLDL